MYAVFEEESISDGSVPGTPDMDSVKEGEKDSTKDDDSKSKVSSVS